MANGTLPLSRLMRLQMAHMRRAQCCLSDFCSVSKVTMIDGYFWINNHFLLSLYAWKNIYIYLCVFILIHALRNFTEQVLLSLRMGTNRVPRVSFNLTQIFSHKFRTISRTGWHSRASTVKFHALSQLIWFSARALTRWWNNPLRKFTPLLATVRCSTQPNNLRIPATIES